MVTKPELRNTPILTILDEILHASSIPWETVELVGRGISAKARCTIAAIEDENRDPHPSANYSDAERMDAIDKLIELGDLEDGLDDLWQRRRADELTTDAFQAQLRDIVERLEEWPAHLA